MSMNDELDGTETAMLKRRLTQKPERIGFIRRSTNPRLGTNVEAFYVDSQDSFIIFANRLFHEILFSEASINAHETLAHCYD